MAQAICGKTTTFTVTNAAFTAVVAQSRTRTIQIAEAPTGTPTDFLIAIPTNADTPLKFYPGQSFTFQRGVTNFGSDVYEIGEVAGFIKLVTSASTTIQQLEPGVAH